MTFIVLFVYFILGTDFICRHEDELQGSKPTIAIGRQGERQHAIVRRLPGKHHDGRGVVPHRSDHRALS